MLHWKKLEEKWKSKVRRFQLRIRYALAFFIISKEFDNDKDLFNDSYDNFMFESATYIINRIGRRVGLSRKSIVKVIVSLYKPKLKKKEEEAVNELLSKSG